MKLIPFYMQLITALGLSQDADGFISRKEGDKAVPLTIKDQRLVLPVDAQLDDPDWSNRVGFNPMYESLGRKESPVHEAIRVCLNIQLNSIFGILVGRLLMISRDTGIHPHLTPDQTNFLSYAKKVDKDTVNNYAKLLDAFPGDRALVNIYSKSGAVIKTIQADGSEKAEKYARGAIVSFPMYEALVSAKDGVVAAPAKNVKVRPKDIEAFKSIMEYVIPNIGKKEFYHVGTLSKMAPTMESLLKAAAPLFGYFNAELELFKDRIPEADGLVVPMEWADEIDSNIGVLYAEARRIGMLQGNEGGAATGADVAQQSTAPIRQAQPSQATSATADTKKQVLINPITGKPMDVTPTPPAPSPFPVPNQAPAQTAWQQPPAFTGNHQSWGGFQPPQPAPVVKANGKADLNAILANNPALAASVGAAPAFQPQQNWQQQERPPSWAQPQASSFTTKRGF